MRGGPGLSDREWQVLDRIDAGDSYGVDARALGISRCVVAGIVHRAGGRTGPTLARLPYTRTAPPRPRPLPLESMVTW